MLDEDLDGFGVEGLSVAVCGMKPGVTDSRGDCDDADAVSHPGASDPEDEVDQDCGGHTGPDPHVALSEGSATSLSAALAAARTVSMMAGS